MIYLVGVWRDTGPRANDCYFEIFYVSLNKDSAFSFASGFTDADVMAAEPDTEFIEWVTAERIVTDVDAGTENTS